MMLGVLGAGQLGLMIARAAASLGATTRFLDPNKSACAQSVGDLIPAPYTDRAALDRFAAGLTAATFEFESIPADAVSYLADKVPTAPPAEALAASQDRLLEKHLLESAGIPVAPWREVSSPQTLRDAIDHLGAPCILKARTGGYDGKSQARILSPDHAPAAWDALTRAPAICEQIIPFDRELSIIAARSHLAQTVFFPTNQSHHTHSILTKTISPAPDLDQSRIAQLHNQITALLDRLQYVGVFTVECFAASDQLIANETAPRVHNTGHWTIEGTAASQFEQHARAVLRLPLAPIRLTYHCAAMLNIIGIEPDPSIAEIPGATLHLYNKSPKPGRKLGHLTITADTYPQLEERTKQAERAYTPLFATAAL
jgi:5-(carboxyamino)imidazole ribonucleotide synthase